MDEKRSNEGDLNLNGDKYDRQAENRGLPVIYFS